LITDADISAVGQLIINELGKELIKQNHRATGNLISSLDYNVEHKGDTLSISVSALGYAEYVNRGRKPKEDKVPIPALIEWIKQKGIETNNKKVVGIAFAIREKIYKEGSPTKGRVRKFGKATGFVDDTLARIDNEVFRRLNDLYFDQVNLSINNFIAV